MKNNTNRNDFGPAAILLAFGIGVALMIWAASPGH